MENRVWILNSCGDLADGWKIMLKNKTVFSSKQRLILEKDFLENGISVTEYKNHLLLFYDKNQFFWLSLTKDEYFIFVYHWNSCHDNLKANHI